MEKELQFSRRDQHLISDPEHLSPDPSLSRYLRQGPLVGLVALGIFLSLLNLRLPVARNAILYMKGALEIIARHFDLYTVVHEETWTGGKPLLFSLVATPFVQVLGGKAGLVATSALGTIFFLLAARLALPRLIRDRTALDPSVLVWGVALMAFNPLVLYQFWSGYPDSTFAGLVLMAFVLSDIIARETSGYFRWNIVLLGLTICAAFHMKLYGSVLIMTCPLYILMASVQHSGRLSLTKSKVVALFVVWAVLGGILAATKMGVNPLLILDTTNGFRDYVAGIQGFDLGYQIDSLSMFLFAVLLAFHVSLFCLFRKSAWKNYNFASTVFFSIYVAGLIPFTGTENNMRYFLPAFAFFPLAIAAGANSLSPSTRRWVLGSYVAIALVLVAVFNIAPINELARPIIMRAYTWEPDLADWLDNLRIPVQMSGKRQIDTINTYVPNGATFYWSSDYYKSGTHGLAHEFGVKNTLDVKYVLEPSDIEPSPHPVFVYWFTSGEPPSRLWRAPGWSVPVSYGNGVFRLDPVSVRLESLSGDYVGDGETVRIRATPMDGSLFTVSSVEFSEGGKELGLYHQPPFELNLSQLESGRHEVVARVRYLERPPLVSSPLVFYVGKPAFERVARETSDLAAEHEDGIELATEEVIWLFRDKRALGFHFRDINVRQHQHIAAGFLEVSAKEAESKSTVLDIRAELSPDANGLRLVDGDLSSRPKTASHVTWKLSSSVTGQRMRSPNLAPILEEVVSQAGWRPGSSIMLLVRVSGQDRLVQAAEVDGSGAPTLIVDLSDP